MRRFFISIFTILCMFLGGFSVRAADPVINDQYPFAIQTTQMSAGKTFSFQVGAKGTFSVDWGDGTTQTYIVSKVGTAFTSSSITNGTTISHTYTNASSADGWNIRIGGNVTQLPAADSDVPTILFYKNTYVKTLHGSLGRLFPTTNGIAPKFNSTFYGCTNLQSLPNGLFDGITGTTSYMFASIFAGCSSLTKIPEKLFAGISGEPAKMMFYYTFSNSGVTGGIPENLFAGISGAPVDRMFSGTFYLCRGLTGSIPENLFAGISGEPADYMFNDTFYYCEGLTGSVPENLFTEFDAYGNYVRGIRGVPAEGMFRNTFRGAAGLTNIPEKLFAGISGAPAAYMFNGTFQSCVGLKGAIPENLFSGIVGAPKAGMFGKTFYDCRQLTSIPQNLFGGISGAPAEGMFEYTFWNDLKLTGYVPRTMFGNITGLGTSSVVGLDYTFSSVPNMSTTCPAGMVTLIRPSSWASVAFCDVCPDGKIAPAGATSIDQCVQPSVICSLGTYLSADLTTCTQCPSAYPNSDAGATAITQCYSNTKYRSWTGVKQACSVANASATCNDCVGVSCNYVAYSNAAGNGDGALKSGCATNNASCNQSVASFTCNAGYYKNGSVCTQCPVARPMSPVGATSESQCFAPSVTCAPGNYLPANSIVCAECVAGAYCGGGDFTFNDTIDAGITSCGTNMTSNAGATSASQCRPDIIAGCEDGYPFRITTIDMPAGAYFNNFKIGAAGTFKIDWGDGSDPEIIQRDNPAVNDLFLGSVDEISHQYTTGGVHTVQICGRATEYYGGDDVRPAVRFADNSNIAELHGDLGALFPVFGSSWNQKPQFFQTFARCNNLKGISENLFDGINGSTRNMFKETFMGDRSLTQIPAGLFSTINQGANGMFVGTFSACENLNTITDGQISYSYVPSSMLLVAGGTEYYQNMFTNTKLDNSCGDDAVSATQGVNNSTWRPNVDDATPVAICTPCSDGEHAVNGSCVTICVDGYTYNPDNKKCEIKCAGGSWIESAGDTQCANVGAGYYAPTHIVIYNEPDTARQQCDDGLTTIGYGRGADEATDCGKRLPLNKDGTKYLYFHPDQRTHPAFMMTSKGVPFYADAAENITGHFQMKLNNKTYGIYNQDIDAPESTEPTEPAESVGGGDRLPS